MSNNTYLSIMAFGLIFLCFVAIAFIYFMKELRDTFKDFQQIHNEELEEPSYDWGDWFINHEGREVQLPDTCTVGFSMEPEDFVRMHRWYSSEHD